MARGLKSGVNRNSCIDFYPLIITKDGLFIAILSLIHSTYFRDFSDMNYSNSVALQKFCSSIVILGVVLAISPRLFLTPVGPKEEGGATIAIASEIACRV
jgi:hypothetical protein